MRNVSGTSSCFTGSGRRDRPSALACCSVGLNSMVYVYAARISAHLWSLAAARGGNTFLGSQQ